MSTSDNKARQRRVWEEVFNKGDLSLVPELFAASYVFHGPMGMEFKGPEGFKQMAIMFRGAFPDLRVVIEDMFAEGDKVVSRVTGQGMHKGSLFGIAPMGKKVSYSGILITRFAGGKEVEAWESADMLGLMQQIGVIPPIKLG